MFCFPELKILNKNN